MSRATAMVAAAQQLSLSTGVAVGALVVEITLRLKGSTTMGVNDFPPAFLFVSLLSASAIFIFYQARAGRGAELSGRSGAEVEVPSKAPQTISAAKPARQQIKLRGTGAARWRLDVLDAFEIALEFGKQRRLGAALQHLAEK